MASQYSVVRERTTRQKVRFWDCPVDVVLKRFNSGFTNPEVGEIVSVNSNDELIRYNPTSGSVVPFGVLLGFPVDPLVYPAFAGDYEGRALVGVSLNAELVVPFYNNGSGGENELQAGDFIPSDRTIFVPDGALVAVIRHPTGRWGIPLQWDATNNRWSYSTPSGITAQFRLVRILPQVFLRGTSSQSGIVEPRLAVVRQIVA